MCVPTLQTGLTAVQWPDYIFMIAADFLGPNSHQDIGGDTSNSPIIMLPD